MAHRAFNITMAVSASYFNLYTLLLAQPGAVPTDGILPDRVSSLTITTNPDGTLPVSIADANYANEPGGSYSDGASYNQTSDRNTIYLRDYWIAGSAETITVDIESK